MRRPTLRRPLPADPYLTPGRDDVLANRLDITDGRELAIVESAVVAEAVRRLGAGEEVVAGNGDEKHLRDLHRYLYEDLYDWAGEYRVGATPSGGVPAGMIRSDVAHTLRIADDQDWETMTAGEVAGVTAETWAGLAGAVPFRAGSLVAATAMIDELAARAGWQIDWDRTSAVEQVRAVELGHHAADLDQVKPAIEVVHAGLRPHLEGPKPAVLRPSRGPTPEGPSVPPPPPRGPDLEGPAMGL